MPPCSCKIPDPIVVNGTCLICYGERGGKEETSDSPLDGAAYDGQQPTETEPPMYRPTGSGSGYEYYGRTLVREVPE